MEKLRRTKSVTEEAHDVVEMRREAYGHPYENLGTIARLWGEVFGVAISPEDVAICMILVKVAREVNMHKRDNLVDICGYADCISEIKEVRGEYNEYKYNGRDDE